MEQITDVQPAVEINKARKGDIWNVDPKMIKIEENFNTRTDFGDIDELKRSIIENGVRVPMRGYKEGEFYVLSDGHRRFEAVSLAIKEGFEIARVPFITEKKKSMEERMFDLILFNDGKQLTPLELGETYKRLQIYGHNLTDIAKKIGKTIKHVSGMITVANSTKGVKDIIKDGFISATLVAEVNAKIGNQERAEEIIKKVRDNQGVVKTKITKKDVVEFLPEDKNKTYTTEEVRELLIKQREYCSGGLPDNYRDLVLMTIIVL